MYTQTDKNIVNASEIYNFFENILVNFFLFSNKRFIIAILKKVAEEREKKDHK